MPLRLAAAALAALGVGYVALHVAHLASHPADAAMTYMWPNFTRIAVPSAASQHYRAFAFADGSFPARQCTSGTVPVLYVPGNAGSYEQARSLGHELASAQHSAWREGQEEDECFRMPLFATDLNEEFSAFDAR